MLTKSKKHSDTSPVCQRHRIAVLSCFILPDLPSQALARQLPQSGSPWQRGLVFDETNLRLLENVAECQSLSPWERWHGEAVTERARMLTKSKKHSDTSPVCQRHRIAVLSCFILPDLPSQALARQLPQSGSPWQRGLVFDETNLRLLENVAECQSLSPWERWHGEAVTERARMLTKSKKHSDTISVCQRHRIAVLSCFILPSLPSQALACQLSQRESPWQRGFVFDETDWGLRENVTECQSLSL